MAKRCLHPYGRMNLVEMMWSLKVIAMTGWWLLVALATWGVILCLLLSCLDLKRIRRWVESKSRV